MTIDEIMTLIGVAINGESQGDAITFLEGIIEECETKMNELKETTDDKA